MTASVKRSFIYSRNLIIKKVKNPGYPVYGPHTQFLLAAELQSGLSKCLQFNHLNLPLKEQDGSVSQAY